MDAPDSWTVIGDTDALVARARALAESGERRILGLVGPPGGGKSTAARVIVDALGAAATLVPMDGFHLCQEELARLERRDRMGAPDTFDAAGFAALLRRLRMPPEPLVYAPEFRRQIEEPIAGAIAVPASVPLVVTEGNYLLLPDGDWADVRPLLDAAWYVEVDEHERIERLIERHIRFGKPPDIARSWTLGTDQRNAELVETTKVRADAIVRLPRILFPAEAAQPPT
jgi:pantothenate kinase